MPYIETRGGSIRVKWFNGGYKPGPDGKPTKTKLYDSASGPEPGVKFADEQEAWDYGLDRETEVRHGKYIPKVDGKTLMRDYCKSWLDALDLRHNSRKTYTSKVNAWIEPHWGGDAVADITTWQYDAWKRSLRARVDRKELSRTHCDQILGLFSMLMDDAVKYKLRPDSPVVHQRRRGRYTKKTREKKYPFEMETLHALAVNAFTVWGYTGWVYVWTIPFTCMRPPGELAGLRREYASPNWPATEPDAEFRKESVDRYADMPALRVQWQLEDGTTRLVDPKYDSHRTLVVPPFLHEMHTALLASHDSDFVFPGMKGGSLGNHFSRIYWRPICDGAPERTGRKNYKRPEIPAVPSMVGKRQYLLRHWGKEMLSEDNHPRIAQESRMGHEVAGVEGLYDNVTPKMERDIVEALQLRWEKFMGPGSTRWQPEFPKPLPEGPAQDG